MMNFDKISIYIDFTKYFNYASKHVINQKQVLVVYCRMQLKEQKIHLCLLHCHCKVHESSNRSFYESDADSDFI